MTTETPRTIYAPENLARDVTRLAESISGKGFEGIFPLNRGGHIIAGYLSGKTGLPVNTCGCHMNSSDLYVADSIRTKEELEEIKWKLRLNPEKPGIENVLLPAFAETIALPLAIPLSLITHVLGSKKQIVYASTREELRERKNPKIIIAIMTFNLFSIFLNSPLLITLQQSHIIVYVLFSIQ